VRIDYDADLVEMIAKQVAALSKDINSEDSIDKKVIHRINALLESTMLLRENIFDGDHLHQVGVVVDAHLQQRDEEVVARREAAVAHLQPINSEDSIDKKVIHRINALLESTMLLRENIFDRQRVLSGILRSERFPNDIYPRLQLMIKDVNSLINHADFSFQRLDYIQDAALGLINIEQNEIVQDLFGGGRDLHARDAHGEYLRHEFPCHARTGLGIHLPRRDDRAVGLPLRHRTHDTLFGGYDLVFPVQKMVVIRRGPHGAAGSVNSPIAWPFSKTSGRSLRRRFF